MYGGKATAVLPATGAAAGMQLGWLALTGIVLVICGFTLVRLARSRPSRMN